jgi:hypothetical protein
LGKLWANVNDGSQDMLFVASDMKTKLGPNGAEVIFSLRRSKIAGAMMSTEINLAILNKGTRVQNSS